MAFSMIRAFEGQIYFLSGCLNLSLPRADCL